MSNDDRGIQVSAVRGAPEARQIGAGSAYPVDQVSLLEASTFTEEMSSRSFRSRRDNVSIGERADVVRKTMSFFPFDIEPAYLCDRL